MIFKNMVTKWSVKEVNVSQDSKKSDFVDTESFVNFFLEKSGSVSFFKMIHGRRSRGVILRVSVTLILRKPW